MNTQYDEENPFDHDHLLENAPSEIIDRSFSYGRIGTAKAKKVFTCNVTIGDFLAKILNHTEGQKDGPAFIPGVTVGSTRSAEAMSQMNAIGLDIDNGTPIEEVKEAIRRHGLFATIYSTHSSYRSEMEINYKHLNKYREGIGPDASLEDAAISYLRDKKSYHPSVLEDVRFGGREITTHGEVFVVQHRPMHKLRVVIFLEKPFDFLSAAPTLAEAHAKWKALLRGCARMLGFVIDEACLDAARLFYFPRHPRGGRFYSWCNTEGRLLDLNAIEPVDPPKKEAHRVAKAAKREAPGDLKRWAAKTSLRFLMASLFRDHAPDHIRNDRSEGKMTVECPFDGEHTNAGDPNDQGCFVRDAEEDPNHPAFTFHCSHNACKDRDRLDFITEAINLGWIDRECLDDEIYQIVEEETFNRDRGEQGKAMPSSCTNNGGSDFKLPHGYVVQKWDGAATFVLKPDDDDKPLKPVCQVFDVLGAASDSNGGSAMVLIGFTDTQGDYKEVSYKRSELARHGPEVASRFENQWFRIYNRSLFVELLGQIVTKTSIMLVARTGWVGSRYLTIGGETLGAEGMELRLVDRMVATDVTAGTLKGWVDAVAPIFENDALGWEHLALGVIAGGAGVVADFWQGSGMPIIALHGLSSRGKSTALRYAASASAAPNEHGTYRTLRGTDNGFEGILPGLSGGTLCFDEAQHAEIKALWKLVWMLREGAGKLRANDQGGARTVHQFSGFALLSNEFALADLFRQGGIKIPRGYEVRVCDIDISDVLDLEPDMVKRVIDGPRAGVEENYGHVTPALAVLLADKTRDEVHAAIDDWVQMIVGDETSGVQRRSATTLAVVGYTGALMQEAALIPRGFDILRVLKWAWARRTDTAMGDPIEIALERLAGGINARRGVDIFDACEMDEPHPREARGWFHGRNNEAYCGLSAEMVAELAGGTIPYKTIVRALEDRGYLIPCSAKNKKHKALNGMSFGHYRIKSSFYAGVQTDN